MKILLLAGEQSGELYAERLRKAFSTDDIRGYADYGFSIADLAVMGFWAVLRRLFFFLRVKRTMKRAIDDWKPDVVCTIDYPGMNLLLAAHAKRRGIRTVHVVCPQVWAWKKGRIPKIEASLDKLCCFFPFEPALFKPGFAEFVGHPLVEEFGADVLPREKGLVALLPGSRRGEIVRNLPAMLESVASFPEVRVSIPAANDMAFEEITRRIGNQERIAVTRGGARDLLRRAECAVVASGTATLEAALARCPTILVYRVSPLLAWFARRVIRGIRHIGLVNIIAEKAGREPPMPELVQEEFTAANIAGYLGEWIGNDALRANLVRKLDETMLQFAQGPNAIARIVSAVRGL